MYTYIEYTGGKDVAMESETTTCDTDRVQCMRTTAVNIITVLTVVAPACCGEYTVQNR